MRENVVRLSFDISVDEHIMLKTTCAQARLAIKDFMHEMMLIGIQELKKSEFQKRLRESIQQSKDGKGRVISSAELDKMVKNGRIRT